MKLKISIGEKYGPAMEVTEQAAADAYFKELVLHNLKCRRAEGEPPIRSEAEAAERSNLGYYAGYYNHETRERVERLFRCSHPIFGAIAVNGAPTTKEAFAAGFDAGFVAAKAGVKAAAKIFA